MKILWSIFVIAYIVATGYLWEWLLYNNPDVMFYFNELYLITALILLFMMRKAITVMRT